MNDGCSRVNGGNGERGWKSNESGAESTTKAGRGNVGRGGRAVLGAAAGGSDNEAKEGVGRASRPTLPLSFPFAFAFPFPFPYGIGRRDCVAVPPIAMNPP
jgi:hypothetical protein